jgi:hypothetical protein
MARSKSAWVSVNFLAALIHIPTKASYLSGDGLVLNQNRGIRESITGAKG